jgi:hypothetical protein
MCCNEFEELGPALDFNFSQIPIRPKPSAGVQGSTCVFTFAFAGADEYSALAGLSEHKGNAAHLLVPCLRFVRRALAESHFICRWKRARDYFVRNRYRKMFLTHQAFNFLVSALRKTCRCRERASVNDLFLTAAGTKN